MSPSHHVILEGKRDRNNLQVERWGKKACPHHQHKIKAKKKGAFVKKKLKKLSNFITGFYAGIVGGENNLWSLTRHYKKMNER